jgi:hypothetical protein
MYELTTHPPTHVASIDTLQQPSILRVQKIFTSSATNSSSHIAAPKSSLLSHIAACTRFASSVASFWAFAAPPAVPVGLVPRLTLDALIRSADALTHIISAATHHYPLQSSWDAASAHKDDYLLFQVPECIGA